MDFLGHKFGFRVDEEKNLIRVVVRSENRWNEAQRYRSYPISEEEAIRYSLSDQWTDLIVVAWNDLRVNNPAGYDKLRVVVVTPRR